MAIMKEKQVEYSITNIDDLKRVLKKIWKEIPLKTLQNCAKSMKKRLQDVIDRKGEFIGK